MASRDEQLWEQVSEALGRRPAWSVQDSPTPGVDPLWAFSPHVKVEFSVYVDAGALVLYEEKTDREQRFDTVEALEACLQANEATAVKGGPPPTRQPRMRWR